MDPSKQLRASIVKSPSTNYGASNDGKVEWNTILPIAYYPLHTAEYATVILASDWLYFSRHGINECIALIHGQLNISCNPLSPKHII